MSGVAATLLALLLVYSYPVAALAVLVAAVGLPIPTAPIVLAAGVFASDGDGDASVFFGVIVLAASGGDLLSYGLGRWGGIALLDRLGPRVGLTPERIEPVQERFDRWGGVLVIVTRCLLPGLAPATNLVAGASGYPLPRFLGCSLLGQSIWAGGLLALGWFYGSNWVALLGYLEDAATTLTALAVAALLGVILVRLLRAKTI
jgi:membrane-associated protein